MIKFKNDKLENGTINIYLKEQTSTYDLIEKERNNLPKLQLISDFEEVIDILTRIQTKNTGKQIADEK